MITRLKKALKKDEGYFISWKANIAMAFYDEYRRCNKKYLNKKDILNIANKGAENFLNLLIKD